MLKLLRAIVPPLCRPWVRALIGLGVGAGALAATYADVAGQFTSRVSLVEVYATVADGAGRLVTDLRAENFTITEDGVPQTVQTFAAGAFPLSVAVGVDRSFSMSDRTLATAVTAARAFAASLQPRDQLMIIGIGSDTEVLAPLSSDRALARRALERLARWGTTPLFDAVVQAIDAIQPAPGRRALILLSDGEDTYSQASEDEVITYSREHDVLVYPVSLGPLGLPVWTEVATVSGGRAYHVRDPRELSAALKAIAEELRHQYLIGYVPSAAGRDGWRTIRVRVNRPQVGVRARDGYLASR